MKLLTSLLPAGLLLATEADAATQNIPRLRDVVVPHRAIYDISLARSDEGSGVISASGRMVFEVTGGACEGFRMRQRMVVNLGDEQGTLGKLDFRVTTFESPAGDVYDFDSQTTMNTEVVEAVEGEARRVPGGIDVKLKGPPEKTVRLDAATLFPSQHLQTILDAAAANQKFVATEIYEGSGDGESSDSATVVIGNAVPGDSEGALRDGVRRWPVSIGYFDAEEESEERLSEETPTYQMRFTLYENGVTNDLIMDYGNYALAGALEEIVPLDAPDCASR
jgi:hypothetical protein